MGGSATVCGGRDAALVSWPALFLGAADRNVNNEVRSTRLGLIMYASRGTRPLEILIAVQHVHVDRPGLHMASEASTALHRTHNSRLRTE